MDSVLWCCLLWVCVVLVVVLYCGTILRFYWLLLWIVLIGGLCVFAGFVLVTFVIWLILGEWCGATGCLGLRDCGFCLFMLAVGWFVMFGCVILFV